MTSAFDKQVGGGHYKDWPIQPLEYIMANAIPFPEGCAIKYISRHREKNGPEDLLKARHFIDLMLERYYGCSVEDDPSLRKVPRDDKGQGRLF